MFLKRRGVAATPNDTLSFLVACESGDHRTVARLLKVHPSLVHYRSKATNRRTYKLGYGEGATGLMLAAERGHRITVETLLQHHADPNYGETGNPAESMNHPLIRACFNGHCSCVNALLKAGADANAVSAFGTPLEILALRYRIEAPEAYALLFLHSKRALRLRTHTEMKQQHTDSDIQRIENNFVRMQRAMRRANVHAKATFRNMSRRSSRQSPQKTLRKRSPHELSKETYVDH